MANEGNVDRITLVSPDGDEVEMDYVEFIVDNYKRLG